MTWNEILGLLKTSIENTAIATVKSLKEHTFKVEMDDRQVQVTADNQKYLEEQAKKANEWLKKVEKALGTLKPLEEVRVANFPKITIPKFPTKVKVEDPVEVSVNNLAEITQALKELEKAVAKLPTKYPEVRIPPFPKIPEYPKFPKPLAFPKAMSVSNLEKLVGKDPKSYVPVRLTDGEEFYEAIVSAVSKGIYAYSTQKGERTQALVDDDRHIQTDILTMPDPTISYQISDTDTGSDPKYYGFVDKDGGWYILKEDSAASTYRYFRGNDGYGESWADRTSLDYGLFSEVF